jgi:hypothetical protein
MVDLDTCAVDFGPRIMDVDSTFADLGTPHPIMDFHTRIMDLDPGTMD